MQASIPRSELVHFTGTMRLPRAHRSAFALVGFSIANSFASHPGPDVLFLNSYHPGLGWSDGVLEGVREGMGPHEQLSVEYLDSKRFEGERGDSIFARLFEHKYRRFLPRVIVASDDYALQFLFQWRDSLFPGVAVVFCGINAYTPDMIEGRKGYTGTSQWNHMFQTAQIITRLLPETRDVWVVTESSATGTGNRRRLDSLAKATGGTLEYHFLDSAGTPSWDEILRLVGSLGPGSVVYWSEMFRDRNGLYIDPDEDLSALVRMSPVPFFTHQASYLSSGILGGDCNHGLQHGIQTGHIVRRILDGESPDSIPVQQDSSVFPTFRKDALERFDIPVELLPPGSVVIGEMLPIWKAYPIQTTVAVIAFIVLLGMAAILLLALGRVRRTSRELAHSEAALRESEAGLRRLFESLSDAVTVFKEDGSIDFMNPAGLKLYGLRSCDLARLSVADLCTALAYETAREEGLWRMVLDGAVHMGEFRARRPLVNEEFDAECSLAPLFAEGRGMVVSVVRDITERVEARRILQRSKEELELLVQERTVELTRANKELEAFTYSVSHDLRSPLRAVNGYAQVLSEELGSILGDEQRMFLERIRSASTRMGEIIDSLLHLSRISTVCLDRQFIPMSQFVESIRAPLAQANPNVEWHVGDLSDGMGDPALILPLWTNLLDNAVKYSSRRQDPRVEIGTFEDGNERVWFVRDNGAGFDKSHSAHLFEPFRRMHTDTEFPGSGIGLATAHRVVHRHGGRIWAEGEVDKGATFFFTLG